MNQKKELVKQMTEFCYLGLPSLDRFENIQPIISVKFGKPELDWIREEICRCYVIAAYHACVTLTNHLLEKYLKYFLIINESGVITIDKLDDLEGRFKEPNEKYLSADLSNTLRMFKTLELITKDEWKQFDKYRKELRNGFGHADPKKMFGDTTKTFDLGTLSTGGIEQKELKFANVPFIHGIATQQLAFDLAMPYYVEVENLMRKTIKHIQPEEYKIEYPLVTLTFPTFESLNSTSL